MEEKIYDLLEEKFSEEAFSDCFLIELKLHRQNKLEVFIDSDTGVTFDRCQQVSRYLEAYLDQAGWLGDQYILEVSSPGVSRPLMLPRQYPKHIGRRLKVSRKDGSELEGRLSAVTDGHIALEHKVTQQGEKKKKQILVTTDIPFEDIRGAWVQISFK